MLGMVKANLQLNMLTINANLSDIVLTHGIVKNFSIVITIQTINIVEI